ncbi:MAG TPA: hypothetical protein VHC86_14930 [Opitutaceae bacterium]|nr:hypothetical protein [Opitutaceae bacterium]
MFHKAAALSAAAVLIALAPAAHALQFGANGHFWYTAADLDGQMQLLNQMGMTEYRIDVHDTTEFGELHAVIDAANRHGITVLPTLHCNTLQLSRDRNNQVETTSSAYQKTFAMAQAYAREFKGQIHAWELDNELEPNALAYSGDTLDTPIDYHDGSPQIPVWPNNWGDPGGESPNDYVASRFNVVEAALKGYSEGVHSVDPSALRIVNATGSHYGFLQRLNADNVVQYEITGYHLYATDQQGGIIGIADQYGSYISHVAALGKPIWLTEFNRTEGAGDGNEGAEATTLAHMAQDIVTYGGQYNIQKAYVYELLDETSPSTNPGADNYEEHMGLYHVDIARSQPLDVNGNFVLTLGSAKPCVAPLAAIIRGNTSAAPVTTVASAPVPVASSPAGASNGPVLADASAGFSGTQGLNGWSYGYFDGDSTSFQLLTSFDGSEWVGIYPWIHLSAGDQHPSLDGLNQVSAVRRWTSNFEGTVHVVGQFQIDRQGDGTGVRVLVDGRTVVGRSLIGVSGPSEVQSFDFTWQVHNGTTIDFAVDPGPCRDLGYDATSLQATISAQ